MGTSNIYERWLRYLEFEGVNDERAVTLPPVLAGGQGFEPRFNGPEPFCLPLADPPMFYLVFYHEAIANAE